MSIITYFTCTHVDQSVCSGNVFRVIVRSIAATMLIFNLTIESVVGTCIYTLSVDLLTCSTLVVHVIELCYY